MLLGLPKYHSVMLPIGPLYPRAFSIFDRTAALYLAVLRCIQLFIDVSHAFLLAFLPKPVDRRFKKSKRSTKCEGSQIYLGNGRN